MAKLLYLPCDLQGHVFLPYHEEANCYIAPKLVDFEDPDEEIRRACQKAGFRYPLVRQFAMHKTVPVFQATVLIPDELANAEEIGGFWKHHVEDLPLNMTWFLRYLIPLMFDPTLDTRKLIWLN
jgi:hypothetical protein